MDSLIAPAKAKTARTILDRFFGYREIKGFGRCPTHLRRWTLLATPWLMVYLHHFIGDDLSRDLHDHPTRFVTIGLRGRYVETSLDPMRRPQVRIHRAPWIRMFAASHAHRVTLFRDETCWALLIVFRTVRDWGFWPNEQWTPWRHYVRRQEDRGTSCVD